MAKQLPTLAEYLASDDYEEFMEALDSATPDELKAHAESVALWENEVDEDSPDFDDVIMYEADLIDRISMNEGK